MLYLNVRTSTLHAPEFIGAEPVARATWLALALYCADQENGGRVVGARAFKDRMWQQLCGVTYKEIEATARDTQLLQWEDNDLVLWSYPADREREQRAKRDAGSRGGKAATESKLEASRLNGSGGGRPRKTQAETQAETSETQAREADNLSKNPTEGKGREREENGKGGETRAGARTTTPPDQGQVSESEPDWLDRMQRLHPGVNVGRELANALKRQSAAGKAVERAWFQEEWLRRCDVQVGGAAVDPVGYDGPPGWRALIGAKYPESHAVRNGVCVLAWSKLPADLKREVLAAGKSEVVACA